MDNANLEIQDDVLVELTYVLSIENDDEERLQSKPHSKQFVQGHNEIVPGLEQALYGMSAGDEKEIVVEAADGYGEVNPDAVKTLSRKSIPTTADAKPGQRVRLLHKRSGEVHKATVVDVQPDAVVLDFNHPLAGKTLTYHVHVDDVRPVSAAGTDNAGEDSVEKETAQDKAASTTSSSNGNAV
jgi:FKBP-type peptidyl-prolyl cis-trans isomerase SlyD